VLTKLSHIITFSIIGGGNWSIRETPKICGRSLTSLGKSKTTDLAH
jgi:hypothetical protein